MKIHFLTFEYEKSLIFHFLPLQPFQIDFIYLFLLQPIPLQKHQHINRIIRYFADVFHIVILKDICLGDSVIRVFHYRRMFTRAANTYAL